MKRLFLLIPFLLLSVCEPYRVIEHNNGTYSAQQVRASHFAGWRNLKTFETKDEACQFIKNRKQEIWGRKQKRVVECDQQK